MNIHLIAIGGAAMHNIALDLALQHNVTGSDDEIYNPSRSRLEVAGLLPKEFGWFPDKITDKLDVVVLGMHAKKDNPELIKALELGLEVLSYPEFIFRQSKDKKRVVIAGSHGKTTTTSMILHVLNKEKIDFDYLVGAQIEGFERMVKLSDAPLIILEGDEYLSSPLDLRPKMLHYQPDIAVITGIAWDHINVFPDFEGYKNQFKNFIETIEENGQLYFFEEDKHLKNILYNHSFKCNATAYNSINLPASELSVFGKHNLQNMEAAKLVCAQLGITHDRFAALIKDFKGAGKRLQLLKETTNFVSYLDFAHAPSKVEATTKAIQGRYPNRKVIAFLELHTFSSLNKNFIPHYKNTLSAADICFVYYDPHTIAHKGMEGLDKEFVAQSFEHQNLKVLETKEELQNELSNISINNSVLLMMSSGKFGGLNLIDEIGALIG